MESPKTAYCVFIDALFDGAGPAVRDGDDKPCVFFSRNDAEKEIADNMITRLQEFIDGERDFEDATTLEEYVAEVSVLPDGSVVDSEGNCFGPRRGEPEKI